jgi:four helix bundle protein
LELIKVVKIMNQPAKTFKDLIVWQKAHTFVLGIYKLSQSLPNHEQFGITSQIRRAAVSIPIDIAEVFPRKTKPDKSKFLNIAQSSLEEVRYYLILVNDLGYSATSDLEKKIREVSKILTAYRRSIYS